MTRVNKPSEQRAQRGALSPAELQALGYFRYHRGRYWERHAWRTGSHPALLQGLRNRLGWRASRSRKGIRGIDNLGRLAVH